MYRTHPPVPFPGVEAMFARLRDRGIKIGLTTGFSRETAQSILNLLNWDDTVKAGVIAVGVLACGMTPESMRELGADFVLDSAAELDSIVP